MIVALTIISLLLADDPNVVRPEAFVIPMPSGVMGIAAVTLAGGEPWVLLSTAKTDCLQRVGYDTTRGRLCYEKAFLPLPELVAKARAPNPDIAVHKEHVILPLVPHRLDGQELVLLFAICDLHGRLVRHLAVPEAEIARGEYVMDFARAGERFAAVIGNGLYVWQLDAHGGGVHRAATRVEVEHGSDILGFDDDGNIVVHVSGMLVWVSPEGRALASVALPAGSGLAKGDLGIVTADGVVDGILVPTYQGLVRANMAGAVKRIYDMAEGELLLAGAPMSKDLYIIAISRKVEDDALGYRSRLLVVAGNTGELVAESEEVSGTLVRVVHLADSELIATLGLTGVGFWTQQVR